MKNFENEYRKMIQDDVPDLWDRIEAGLSEKEQVRKTESIRKSEQNEKNNVVLVKQKMSGRKVLKYSGIAAACLCVAILLPGMISLMGRNKGAMGETAMKDVAMEETEMAVAEESPAEMEMTESEEMTEAGLYAGNERSERADGNTIEHVRIKIMGVEELKYHTTYQAEVLEDAGDILKEGESLEFIAENMQNNAWKEGEVCTVTLQYTPGATIPFHLVAEK